MLWSRNYLLRLQLRLRLSRSYDSASGAGSNFSFVYLPVCTASKLTGRFFMFFRNEYRLNLLALSYSKLITIFIYYFSLIRSRSRNTGSGSGSSQKFRLFAALAPHTVYSSEDYCIWDGRKSAETIPAYNNICTLRNVRISR